MLNGINRQTCVSPRLFQYAARARRNVHRKNARIFSTAAETAPESAQDSKSGQPVSNKNTSVGFPDPGTEHHGFTLRRVREVPELELHALHYTHNKTGCEYLHLGKNDSNNVFSIGFKTNPPDRTGVPHILEHVTLCGSQKYPVRDPFFKMMPRSLNNFMNAMTYPDHTVYPFATTNPQDFRNLVDVYLDATLHPLLREQDFAQEGWRLAPQDSKVPTSRENPLVFKGVVYNEMKGNMSNADYLFRQRWQDHVFPSINDSGGDPQKMTDLTFAQLKEFQEQHYNATNARILTYGNMEVGEHLRQLDRELSRHIQENVSHELKQPISLEEGPQLVTVKGPVDLLYPRHQQYKASITWIMGDTSDILENFALGLISSILLDGFTAPLYQNTIGVGWGASFTSNTGYDSSSKTGMFTIGLNGLRKHDVGRVKDGLDNTLRYVKTIGFDEKKIEGRLHQIEIDLKHKSAEFGLGIVSRLQDVWFNGTDPMSAVAPEEVLNAFRAKLESQERYLENLFERYWLHDRTFTFVMEPSDAFDDEAKAEEATRLQRKVNDFSRQHTSREEAAQVLEKQELNLEAVQESGSDEDISSLPCVSIADIPRQTVQKDVRHHTLTTANGATEVQWRETPTNGLTYFRAIQPLHNLPDDLRIYLPLFSTAIQSIGTRRLSLNVLEDSLRYLTGGISVSPFATTSPYDIASSTEGIVFAGSALDRNAHHMLRLLGMAVVETDFTKTSTQKKLAELIKASASTAINDVADSGHSFARQFAEAGISPQARLNEQTEGLTQTRLMLDLANRPPDASYEDVAHMLHRIQLIALSASANKRVAITCGHEAVQQNEKSVQIFLESLPNREDGPPQEPGQVPYPKDAKVFFPLPYQVYYSALAMTTVPYMHPDSAPLAVLAQLMTHKYVHPEIREKGGAYGGSAYASALQGTFGFTSYRDPNAKRTLEVMRSAGSWAVKRAWTDQEIQEAKLSLFQSVDAPESVNEEGMTRFLHGINHDMEQERRGRLLDVSSSELTIVAEKYLRNPARGDGTTTGGRNEVVLGAEQDWLGGKAGWTEMSLGSAPRIEEKKEQEREEENAYLTL